MNDSFERYYYKFLGIDNKDSLENITIVSSEDRNIKINDFMYYPVIIGYLNGKYVISVSDKFYDELKDSIDTNENIDEIKKTINDYLDKKDEKHYKKDMYRMNLDLKNITECEYQVVRLDDKYKEIFLNSSTNLSGVNKEKKWDNFKKYIDLRLLFWYIK